MNAGPTKTLKTGTWTTDGFVPHYKLTRDGEDLHLPVKVNLRKGASVAELSMFPTPMRDGNGHYIYALPGGGAYVPEWVV